jgi:NAD(P)-dependent dehydrogenase (short-subunit alcohol dehydrogenase family)
MPIETFNKSDVPQGGDRLPDVRSAERRDPKPPPPPAGPRYSLAYALAGLGAGAVLASHLFSRRPPPYSFEGRTVLITGGARGLGFILARQLGLEGARVVLVSRSHDELQRAERRLTAEGIHAFALSADVRLEDHANAAVEAAVQQTGRLDLLVNNAGVIQATPFEHARLEDFDDSLRTHFWGPLYLIRAALPHLKRPGGTRILNVSSIGGRIGVPHLAPYCAGKFALVGLSEALRPELAKDDIWVTTATPGLMRTGSHGRVQIRGRHRAEARWFGLAVATPLSSMNADRAARQMIEACRRARAHVTPGTQARLGEAMNILAPELTSAISATLTRTVLPGPVGEEGDRLREASEVGFGWVRPLMPDSAAARNNEIPSQAP